MKNLIAVFIACLLVFACNKHEDQSIIIKNNMTEGIKLEYDYLVKAQWKSYTPDTVFRSVEMDEIVKLDMEYREKISDSVIKIYEKTTTQKISGYHNDECFEDTTKKVDEITYYLNRNGQVSNLDLITEPGWGVEDFYKYQAEQAYPKYPDHPVTPGYSWTQTTKVVLPDETLETSINYNIKSFVREAGYDCILIEYEGNSVIPYSELPDDTTHTSGLDFNRISGLHYFAYKEGITILQKINWSAEGKRRRFLENKWLDYEITINKNSEMRLTSNSAKK